MSYSLSSIRKYLGQSTSKAYILSNLICCPFFGIFALLPMILSKELNASPLQIGTLVTIKPLTALFATYWSGSRLGNRHQDSLVWGYFLKFFPFLFFPFFSDPWIFIFAFAIHMLLLRGVIPSWIELLKTNLAKEDCGKVVALSSTANYLATALIPFLFIWVLDYYQGSWRLVFLMTSLLGMCSIWFILKMGGGYVYRNTRKNWNFGKKAPQNLSAERVSIARGQDTSEHTNFEKKPTTPKTNSCVYFGIKEVHKKDLKQHLFDPWVKAKTLLKKRPDFFLFQIGFFCGGAGLMTMHAVIPKYFTEYLKLSYTEMLFAICFCKGIGFAIASPFWVRLFNRSQIFTFSSYVPLLAIAFPTLLILAHINPFFVFFAYLIYGGMQAGSELGWKMSGPVFAKEEDSSPFSSINILAVGIRGGVFPYFGAVLFMLSGPYVAFIVGGTFCFLGSIVLWSGRKTHTTEAYSSP